jgi:hypothetical protein
MPDPVTCPHIDVSGNFRRTYLQSHLVPLSSKVLIPEDMIRIKKKTVPLGGRGVLFFILAPISLCDVGLFVEFDKLSTKPMYLTVIRRKRLKKSRKAI